MKSYLLVSHLTSTAYIMRFYEEYIIEYRFNISNEFLTFNSYNKKTRIYKKIPDYDYIKAWKNFWVVKEI